MNSDTEESQQQYCLPQLTSALVHDGKSPGADLRSFQAFLSLPHVNLRLHDGQTLRVPLVDLSLPLIG